MRSFSTSVDIAAQTGRVWEVMTDVERWSEWTPSVTRVTRLDHAPFGVGSRAHVEQPKLPRAVWRVTEIEPGRSFTWVNTGPGVRVVGRHTVEATPTGSRATLSVDFQGPIGGLVGLMTKRLTERYLGFEADGLKARSEDPAFRRAQTGG